jgi:membrane protease subunit (stomatin/prohibitin family)
MALLDVVRWDPMPGEILAAFPEGAIALGAQLIVRENQEAILFKEGRALDSFRPGRHTLKTGNIPILEKVINLPFGGQTPFPAEVFFVVKTEIPNLKWGTKLPILLQDPFYNLAVPVRAFGSYSLRVKDARAFLLMAIGTWKASTTEEVGAALRDLVILPKLQDFISETLYSQKVSVLKIMTLIEEIGIAGKGKISEEFASFGLEAVRFVVESINVPEDDESVIQLRRALADRAEIDILGQDRYRMKRTFDTMEKAASTEGSNLMGAGLGLGAGAGMGMGMAGMVQNAMAPAFSPGAKVACPHCRAENAPQARFCSACGKEMATTRQCPRCNAATPGSAKFCPECGAGLQEAACPKCNAALQPGTKFCSECGQKLA